MSLGAPPPSAPDSSVLAAALDCVDMGVLVLDARLYVGFANEGYRRMMGLTADVCSAGANFVDVLWILADRGECGGGEVEDIVERRLEPVRSHRRISELWQRPTGQVLSIGGAPLADGGYVYTFTDVTAQHIAAESVKAASRASVLALADLAEFRDTDTGDHVVRVSRLVHEIARTMRRQGTLDVADSGLFCGQVAVASMLHDIGKVTVSDDILRKPGALDDEERRQMQLHAGEGHRLLSKAAAIAPPGSYLVLAAEIARSHHERTDGGGYPDRLAGEAIPMAARIVAVADVFDALTGERPYKKPWPVEEAVAYVVQQAGRQFDPAVVDAFKVVMADRAKTPAIRWVPEMSVGNAMLDRDHRILIGLVNQLAQEDNHDDRAMLDLVLDELAGYVASHFAREEEFMAEVGFDGLEMHRAQHRRLARELNKFRTRVAAGKALPGEHLQMFLASWLRRHILVEDMRYVVRA